jgi:hypothetical protein
MSSDIYTILEILGQRQRVGKSEATTLCDVGVNTAPATDCYNQPLTRHDSTEV